MFVLCVSTGDGVMIPLIPFNEHPINEFNVLIGSLNNTINVTLSPIIITSGSINTIVTGLITFNVIGTDIDSPSVTIVTVTVSNPGSNRGDTQTRVVGLLGYALTM